jgi:hypothetical protein
VPAQPAQVALVQRMDVDVRGVRLEQGAGDPIAAQHRNLLAGLRDVEAACVVADRAQDLPLLVEIGNCSGVATISTPRSARIAVSVKPAGGCSRKRRLAIVSARTCGVP